MATYEEKCAAVERIDQERKKMCEEILKRYEEKKNAWRKDMEIKPKCRLSKKALKEMGLKIITQ